MRVFVIDDSPSVVATLRRAVEAISGSEVLSFLHPGDALDRLEDQTPDLILVDYMMPGMNGVEVISHVRKNRLTAHVPAIMITSRKETDIKLAAMEAGATEFLNKPIDEMELTIRVRNILSIGEERLAIAAKATALQNDFDAAMKRVERREEEIIWRLSKAIACRHGETADHLDRVAIVARMIAEEVGLGARHCRTIFLASALHDIGKIGLPDAILSKPGPLSVEERRQMQKHTDFGGEILGESSSELIQIAQRIAESHHEKWDGTGYPRGLSTGSIPIEARIVAIADVFDALCSKRSYKAAWPIADAFREIVNSSGTHFDPACVAAFCRRWTDIKSLFEQQQDDSDPMTTVPPLQLSRGLA
ncbi:response regulator [Rhizobium sp. P38BS-XIX]|uniref:HD domain-containing phosphohydrolase n=1 Tax=Rhizobium sp. P38BS-XIX TaxID=2726740 RepID=UPI001456A76C|nr:HD domain-containing phosphohydrolase [Rhizobium sp. P38BS-XIX]NLR98241.1 response regulator [Rhizobium sp. P38BS-XIX]